MTQRQKIFGYQVQRLDRPPLREALRVLDQHKHLGLIGSRFYIVRRGSKMLYPRWDASEIVVLGVRGQDGEPGTHAFPWMRRIGFGIFMRGAVRAMKRCPPYEVPPYVDGIVP